MIESIIFILGCVVGLAIGLIWGHRRGFVAGAKTVPFLPAMTQPVQLFERKLTKIQFSHWIVVDHAPEARMMHSTQIVRLMCDEVAKSLLDARIIKPVILEQSGPDGDVWNIGCSLLATADPLFDEYPNFTIFEPH